MANKSEYIDQATLHELLKPYAYKVFKDLSTESHRVIDMFYGGYSPYMYQRTFGMKNLFKPSINKTETGYEVEFIYSVGYLTTEHRSNEAVFDGSFIHGWHGGQYAWGHLKQETPRTDPSPWRLLELYVRSYKI